ncbi:MAG TPA: Mur ligase family protein [Candidatus Limnocylindrales bacterium]
MSTGRAGPGGIGDDPTYAEALAALQARGRFGIRLGLGRVRALLHAMGDPQATVPGALVAGTNGKGSVIALAGSALRAAGYRVGETPKPHLVTYRERIVVDGRPITADDFTRLVGSVLRIADTATRGLGPATEFELMTAVMFRHFADSGLDLALVEVGLGGRLDATNVWDGGVAALTNVALDHTEYLGPTIGAIAREKVKIVKRGDLAVTGADGEALTILRRRCAGLGVALMVAPSAPVLGWTRDTLSVDLPRLGATEIGLRGRHQAANVAIADALLDALDAAGIAKVPDDVRRLGYRDARWPGRLELLHVRGGRGGTREVLLDGAHNPAGAAALAAALGDLRPLLAGGDETPPSPLVVVWASMADKDVEGTIAAAARADALHGATVICTAPALPRALAPDALAAAWSRSGVPRLAVRTAPSPDAALDDAMALGDGPVVLAGSLSLVGAARSRLVDDPLLRDPVAA